MALPSSPPQHTSRRQASSLIAEWLTSVICLTCRGAVRITPPLTLLTASSLHRWSEPLFMVRDAKSGHLQVKLASVVREAQHIHAEQPQCPYMQAVLCLYLSSSQWHRVTNHYQILKAISVPKSIHPTTLLGLHIPPLSQSRHFHHSR